MFNVERKTTNAKFTVYEVRVENGKTLFLIYNTVTYDWEWVNAKEFRPGK